MPAALWAAIVPAAIGMPDFGRSLSADEGKVTFPPSLPPQAKRGQGRAA